MRFLTDQDVYRVTILHLRDLGHDVATAAESNLAQASDSDLLKVAQSDRRILVTRDRDFGGLVFVQALRTGVVYLRMLPSNASAVHAELNRILGRYTESDLLNAFLVIEPARHRMRKLK